MATNPPPAGFRDFPCSQCGGLIRIPENLPITTAPCPMCGASVTSPAPKAAFTPAAPAPAIPSHTPPAAAPAPPGPPLVSRGGHIPREQPSATTRPAPPPGRPLLVVAAIAIVALMIVALIATAGYFAWKEMKRLPAPPPASTAEDMPAIHDPVEDRFIRIGWQSEAREVLAAFISANTIEEKLKHVLRPDLLRERMEAFYDDPAIHNKHTPAEAFSAYILTEEDRRRGLFLMTYDQPPHFDIRGFFRPLAPIEVQYELEAPDMLLSEVSRATNFSIDPVRIHAFFKRTDDGLKLDWEIFAQKKDRTFHSFVDLPTPGASAVFRVLILEDVPIRGTAVSGTRTYRFADPANNLDSTRINVPVDSEIGRILSVLNWRGSVETKPIVKNATVELKWSDDSQNPVLTISRFICWEFIGLGGRPEPGTFDGY